MTSLYERFRSGDCKRVWQELNQLGEKGFAPAYFEDVQAVVNETMLRTRYNLDLLYKVLQDNGYQFEHPEEARLLPAYNTDHLLNRLKTAVSPVGHLPLSICEFYKTVGSVDFTWSWELEAYFPFNQLYTDAIVVFKLQDATELVEEQIADWSEENEYRLTVEEETEGLWLAPDHYHKDNVSGGSGYNLALTQTPSIDAAFPVDNEMGYQTTFVEYLRLCFKWAGFPGFAGSGIDLPQFLHKIKKELKNI
jgi:hypothetical protein